MSFEEGHVGQPNCPPINQLRRLLSEQLEGDLQVAVSRHVDSCAICQGTLDGLTAPMADSVVSDHSTVEHDPALLELMGKLRSALPKLEDASSAVEADPRAPMTLDDFELGDRLGEGGMGVVYRATQRSLNKPVAIKVLERVDTRNRVLVERFLREARAAASLRHPHIVDVHGIGRTNEGGYFLVMDLVEGRDLERLVRTGRAPSNAADVVATIASAIHHAHEHGVIHRDLKPSNVLISSDERVLVTDFGVAKVLQGEAKTISRHAEPIGTPNYMAPEQADPRRANVGPATDVYGLGGILYFLLTGRHPYIAGDGGELAVLGQVLSSEPPTPPRQLRSDVPVELERVCLKCLSKEPGDRYSSAQDVAEALRELSEIDTQTSGARCARPQPPTVSLALGNSRAKVNSVTIPREPRCRRVRLLLRVDLRCSTNAA